MPRLLSALLDGPADDQQQSSNGRYVYAECRIPADTKVDPSTMLGACVVVPFNSAHSSAGGGILYDVASELRGTAAQCARLDADIQSTR
jgi:hypothetical protein